MATFPTLSVKYADIVGASGNSLTYKVYWIQTFKSLDDLRDYITNVDHLTYEVKK